MDDETTETPGNQQPEPETPAGREPEPGPPRRLRLTRERAVVLAVALAGLLVVAVAAAFAYRPLLSLLAPATATPPVAPPSAAPPTPTETVHYGPMVLAAIRTEARLQTIRLTFVNDADITRPSGIGNLCTERIVYLGYYDVTAGVDLDKIAEKDIRVVQANGQMTVTLTLPPPELMDVTLDTAQSRLLVQETPKWVPGCETHVADMTLEAQQGIRDYATEAALRAGILGQAQEKAGFVLQRLLYGLGYHNVVVRYSAPATPAP